MIRVQEEPFELGAEFSALLAGRTDIGGVASFLGVMRGGTGPDAPTAMTLEHYPGMTERELAAIEAEARSRWSLLGVTLIHRHGRLRPGDQIVLVLTASAHRRDALEACAFLIDYLKTRAPFWKLEESLEGDHWVAARAEDGATAAAWTAPSAAS